MNIVTVSPIKAYIDYCTPEELSTLRKQLTYTNTSAQHLLKRHNFNHMWKARNLESWTAHLEILKQDVKKCLVFEDNQGVYIRPGSIPYLDSTIYNLQTVNHVKYPTPKKVPWLKPIPFDFHPYQEESWPKLLEEKHGNVSLTTGSGKSAVILRLCREMGLNTCIVVPSKSIFEELTDKFEYHFGKKYVGQFGNGKKKLGKKFTVAIGDSLANVKLDSEEHKFFSSLDVLIVDESHEFAAESLEEVCHGVLSSIPYRFFFSATQFRNDGSSPLLQSIIGKTVCELSTAEAVQKGYICNHDFRIVSVESSNPSFNSSDALELKRMHFLKNTNIAQFSAKLANAMGSQGKGTLVLVSELSQIAMLVPLLKVPFAIAHSEKNKERLLELGLDKVDNAESVEKFNKNEAKVLIGTSCVATGTNIFPCHSVVNWVGGSSPIKTKQGAVGRAVRHGASNPWADKCLPKEKSTIYDFDIQNENTMQRHLEARLECYKESGTEIRYVRLK